MSKRGLDLFGSRFCPEVIADIRLWDCLAVIWFSFELYRDEIRFHLLPNLAINPEMLSHLKYLFPESR
jgi:hypothetical protein